jgi:hypothetical protein
MSLMRNILIVVLVWALFGATNAMAKSHIHGDHHQHQTTTVSPFAGKKEVQSLHCLLRAHTHQGFCPHSKPERNQTAQIATDCGGNASGAIPNSTSFGSEFAEASATPLIQSSPDEKLTPIVLMSYHRFIDSLDPPPRVL